MALQFFNKWINNKQTKNSSLFISHTPLETMPSWLPLARAASFGSDVAQANCHKPDLYYQNNNNSYKQLWKMSVDYTNITKTKILGRVGKSEKWWTATKATDDLTCHMTLPLDPGPYGILENPFPLLLFLSKLNINLTIHQMRILQPEPRWKTSWVRSSKRDPSVSCQVVFVSHSLTKGSQICQGLFAVQESQTCTTQVTEKGKEKFYQTHWPISTRPLYFYLQQKWTDWSRQS